MPLVGTSYVTVFVHCVAYIIDRGYHKTLLARELDLLLVLAVTIRP